MDRLGRGGSLEDCEYAFALSRDQALYYFLCHVFGGVVEQVFELEGSKLAYHVFFFANHQRVLSIELVEPLFLLEHVLNQPSAAIGHFGQAIAKSHLEHLLVDCGARRLCDVRRVPHVVLDKSFHLVHFSNGQCCVLFLR